jgi:DNA repair exonuclease SbcCD ATPase subunit
MYDKAVENTKEELKALALTLATSSGALRSRTDQIANLKQELDKQKQAVADLDFREKEALEKLQVEMLRLHNTIEIHQKRLIALVEDRARASDLRRGSLERQGNAVSLATSIRNSLNILSIEVRNLESDVQRCQGVGAVCPVCLQSVDANLLEQHVAESVEKLTDLCARSEELKAALMAADVEVGTIRKQVDMADRALVSLEQEEYRVRNEVDVMSRQREGLKSQADSMQFRRNSILERVSFVQQTIDTLIVGLPELNDECLRLTNEQKHWDFWKTAIPNCRAAAVSDVLEFINLRVAEYLLAFSDGALGMRLYQEEYGQGTRIKTDLRTPAGTYNLSSGGEKRRVDISLYLALADLMKTTSGVTCNLMCVDELTEGLSSAGTRRFMDLLRAKSQVGTCIMVITHNSAVKQACSFDSVYTVERKQGLANLLLS